MDSRERPTAADRAYLEQALALALEASRSIEPDPYVGALVVAADGVVIGEGFHAVRGGPHAEPIALAAAGERSRGATLYCSLEPCCYDAPQKRQPPCTAAIIDSGIRRVVIGVTDPHPSVNGGGVRTLEAAGIAVALAADGARFLAASSAYRAALEGARFPDR